MIVYFKKALLNYAMSFFIDKLFFSAKYWAHELKVFYLCLDTCNISLNANFGSPEPILGSEMSISLEGQVMHESS